jgi:hypothetical protein
LNGPFSDGFFFRLSVGIWQPDKKFGH